MVTASDLNQRFAIAGLVSVLEGQGGLPKIVVTTPAATGELYLHGGHVTSWAPAGSREVLYCSPNSSFQDGKAIRGGIPVCFPWFGDKADAHGAPAHGLVRTREWALESVERDGDSVAVSVAIASSAGDRKWWPSEFRLACRATFGSQLQVELTATNTGTSPYSIEEALHAYFHVGDVESVSVTGLDATGYIDKVDHFTEKLQVGAVRFSGETDRVYVQTPADLEIADPAWDRVIVVRKSSSENTVTWNPWAQKSSSMADLGAGQWKNFVCVETANIGAAAIPLAPGESHTMAVQVSVRERK